MMPQAPQELREYWRHGEYDDPEGIQGADYRAHQHLIQNGYRANRNFTFTRIKPEAPTERDLKALWFLILEWDYGGLEE